MKVGDRVRAREDDGIRGLKGKTGYIRAEERDEGVTYLLVSFDENVRGHSGWREGITGIPSGHGWWCKEDNLEVISIEGHKADAGKPRLDLVSPEALTQLARVLTHGAAKYGDNTWRSGLAWSRCYAAAQRHLLAWWSGETTDADSGLPHLAHALCNLMFLVEYAKTHPEGDDRYVSLS